MPITYHTTQATPDVHSVDLEVFQSGDSGLIVKAGAFRVSSVDYNLYGDVDISLTMGNQYPVWVDGWLVKSVVTGEIFVLVDEYAMNGEDARYEFDSQSPYTKIFNLFQFEITPTIASLNLVDVVVHRLADKHA